MLKCYFQRDWCPETQISLLESGEIVRGPEEGADEKQQCWYQGRQNCHQSPQTSSNSQERHAVLPISDSLSTSPVQLFYKLWGTEYISSVRSSITYGSSRTACLPATGFQSFLQSSYLYLQTFFSTIYFFRVFCLFCFLFLPICHEAEQFPGSKQKSTLIERLSYLILTGHRMLIMFLKR